jgi:hypothetical protein
VGKGLQTPEKLREPQALVGDEIRLFSPKTEIFL